MLHVNGGSTTFDAPLLTPNNTDPAKIVADKKERPNRTRRIVVRDEKSDIATEYFAVFETNRRLQGMRRQVHS
jgi:hypothetical protein